MTRRRLTPDESNLWRRITKDVAPLDETAVLRAPTTHPGSNPSVNPSANTRERRQPLGQPMGPDAENGRRAAPPKADKGANSTGIANPPSSFFRRRDGPAGSAKKAGSTPAGDSAWQAGDPRRDKLAANRRLPIDRVLDLHGQTQANAQPLLVAFIKAAYRDRCRCVLVITGKGGPASASAMTRRRMRSNDRDRHADDQRRGVLRDRVREWIDGPALRPFVARLSSARPRDGGAGAYYVHLKA